MYINCPLVYIGLYRTAIDTSLDYYFEKNNFLYLLLILNDFVFIQNQVMDL